MADYRYYQDYDRVWRVQMNVPSLMPFEPKNLKEWLGGQQSGYIDNWTTIEQRFATPVDARHYIAQARERAAFKPAYIYMGE